MINYSFIILYSSAKIEYNIMIFNSVVRISQII